MTSERSTRSSWEEGAPAVLAVVGWVDGPFYSTHREAGRVVGRARSSARSVPSFRCRSKAASGHACRPTDTGRPTIFTQSSQAGRCRDGVAARGPRIRVAARPLVSGRNLSAHRGPMNPGHPRPDRHAPGLRTARRSALAAVGMAVGVWGPAPSAWAQSLTEDLGPYERKALADALEARDLQIDSNPEDKVIGTIHVVNLDVFGEDEAEILQWFNAFHVTTKEEIIRREVLLQPGMPFEKKKVFETKRNLRDVRFTTLVVAVPVESAAPGEVDLLVVTKDVWSLRLSTRFEFQEDTFTRLRIGLSENNFLGRRKLVGVLFDMDQGSYSIGPSFVDPNIRGSWLRLTHESGLVFARRDSDLEGSFSLTRFELPLYALDRKWGAGFEVSHSERIVRSFVGTELRTWDDPETSVVESIPRIFRDVQIRGEAWVVRSFPGRIIHRVQLGYRFDWLRPETVDQPFDETAAESRFREEVLPRSERRSAPFVRYTLFTPRFRIYRNIATFDFPEDIQAGPNIFVELSPGLRIFGSQFDALRLEGRLRWLFDFSDDSYSVVTARAETRFQGEEFIDNLLGFRGAAASPTLFGAFRFVARVRFDALLRERQNRFLVLGGETGLRGYPVGAFAGDRSFVMNLEARSRSVRVWTLRLGAVAFYDVGHAWDESIGVVDGAGRETSPRLRHDLGAGARLVIPQTGTATWRFDWAFATDGPTAGFPGRFSAGFGQYF
jgi:hypothetical protein